MNSKERIHNILHGLPHDRIGLFEHFWGDTRNVWTEQGHIQEKEDLSEHFSFDMNQTWCFNNLAKWDFKAEIIEEDENTVLKKDGNGAYLRNHKKHNATPEHVDFTVKDRATWEEHIVPYLKPDACRINLESYRETKKKAAEDDLYFVWGGVSVFELMHPVCGHEYMLMGMVEDPDWIEDMAMSYADYNINMLEILFEKEGKPDGLWFYEDMGFKERPFMGPGMYEEMIQPAHKKIHDFAHANDLPVIMHSCGFIEPLLPGMIESGIDCLQVMEIKAGMNPLRIHEKYGDQIALCGGLDARNLVANDLNAIDKELEDKIPILKNGKGFILHSDHSIPTTTEYETYRHFVDKGLSLGMRA